MSKRIEPSAPRFHALWENLEGKRIFIMKKEDWPLIISSSGSPVHLDLEKLQNTPIGNIVNNPGFLGAIEESKEDLVTIKIFREDPKDDPTPINVDLYSVWESFPPNIQILRGDMIQTADTNYDANFREYEESHIFLIKEDSGEDHWLKDPPPDVFALFEDLD